MLGTLGVSGFELKNVARELDIGPSLIHHYYNSGEELIFDTVIYSYQKHINRIRAEAEGEKNPEKVLRIWVNQTIKWTLEFPGVATNLEFPRQIIRAGSKYADEAELILQEFLKVIGELGIINVTFMSSAVRCLQKGKEFKIFSGAQIAAYIKADPKFAMFASITGFATIGGGLWMAGRQPGSKKMPLWKKVGFNPEKQMTDSTNQLIKLIKAQNQG
jgi:AcrR family transcriptional regulator